MEGEFNFRSSGEKDVMADAKARHRSAVTSVKARLKFNDVCPCLSLQSANRF